VDFRFHNGDALAMPRHRAFDEEQVLWAATELFWKRGYLTTSVDELQGATGLSRSSLYLAFGAKRDLFAAALRVDQRTFIDPLLGPLERQGAGLREIVGFFNIVATLFKDPESQRGSLMVNTIGECGGHDPDFTRQGAEFLQRLRSAFANAMKTSVRAGVMTRHQATQRAALLAGATVGAWMTVRADPAAARTLCLSAVFQIDSWASQVG
jgi:TetR/AcrR family transcriptional repressor of nem operon